MQAIALGCVALLLLGLAIWSGRLVGGVTRIGTALEEQTRWMHHAEYVRRQVVDFALGAGAGSLDHVPLRLEQTLIQGRAHRSYPLGKSGIRGALDAWKAASGELVEAARELRRRPEERAAILSRMIGAANDLDGAVSVAVYEVRRSSEELAEGLHTRWSALYALMGFSLATLGTLLLLLVKLRRQAIMLHQQEGRFRTLVQTAQSLIWSVDATGRWTFTNEAVREIYGREPEDFIGKPFTEFSAPDRMVPDRDMLLQVLEGEACLNYETGHMREDGGYVHLIVNARPVRDNRERVVGAMGTALDVTTLRQMQERQARDERIRSLGSLAGGVAHDFKNLLTVMVGQAELARTDAAGNPALERRLDTILSTGERGRRLVEQLLAFAHNRESRPGEIDLVAVVHQMDELIRRLTPDEVVVETVTPEQPVRVRGDWSQLEQVIVNLVLNARDALPEGGRVTIRVGLRREEGEDTDAWAELEVADDGVGMPKKVLARIFEPFFTTKPPGKGSGLGLATVYSIVLQHGGSVAAESAPGKGTRFRVRLPLASRAAPVSVA